jgi:energy-coupling factor transporter ATP-binding protein EcfA2
MPGDNASRKSAAQELINDTRFLFRLGEKIGELGVVHERRNRLIVPLTCLTAHLRTKVSLILTGPSGCGKSTIPEITTKLLPPESVIKRASFSRKAFAYGKEPLDGKILYVAEYCGGAEAQHMLRILQSEGELAHEYTVGGKTKVVQRLGSPVVVTTTTDETLFEDDSTRFLAIRVSEAPHKILAVLKNAIARSSQIEKPPVEVWQEAFRLLQKRAEKDFKFPGWLDFVAENLPREQVRVQRDWKRFLGLLQAVALCRPQIGATTKVTFADYCVAYRIVNGAFTATTHAVSENEISIQKVVKRLTSESGQAATIKKIRGELGWAEGAVYKYIRLAAKNGLVKHEEGTREKNIKRIWPTERLANDFLPNPRLVLDHIGRGGVKADYIDPLTGEKKAL